MNFSPSQLKAINTKNKNILVSAAAGSGKTAVLVQRVVETVRNPENSIDRLLVVTFTRAAAAEMLIRIEKAIKEILALPQTRHKEHLRKQLRLLGRAEITTIDSFCSRLLKKYFYKTDMDPNFMLGEEIRLSSLKQEAMDKIIQNAFAEYEKGNELYKPLYDLCDMLSSGSTQELKLEGEIIQIQKALYALPYPRRCLDATWKALNTASYDEYADSDFCRIIRKGLGLETAFNLISKADEILKEHFKNNFLEEEKKFIGNLCNEEDNEAFIKALSDYVFPRWSNSKKADPEQNDRAKGLRDGAKAIIQNARADAKVLGRSGYEKYAANLPLLRLLYTLVESFIDEYEGIKRKKNMYEFSDVERACLNMLSDDSGNPTELALELRERYDEIITDEYQDTSPLQEAILNAVSGRNNRFMVGDIKQSIYAFRNADPSIFIDKYNSYEGSDEESDNMLIRLAENYRSRKHILDFVNLVFSKIMTKDLGGVMYEPLNFPKGSENTGEGCKTEILIVNRTTVPEPPVGTEDSDILRNLAENDAAIEAVVIAKRIKEIMAEDKSIRFGDIVILANKLKNIAEALIDTLALCGIPAVTDKPAESTNFIENKTIISLLKTIDNPLSDIDLVTVLHSPIYRLSANELAQVGLSRPFADVPFYEVIKQYVENNNDDISDKLSGFIDDITYFGNKFKTEPVSAVLSEIYYKTDYYNYLSLLTDSGKRRANLDKLVEHAASYDKNPNGGLYGFLRYIRELTGVGEMKQAQILNPENNVVHIMTIHSSKGLQFPIVFLCNVQKDFKKAGGYGKILFDNKLGICSYGYTPETQSYFRTAPYMAAKLNKDREKIDETMRLYYVAMTRAEKKLIITGSEKLRTTKNIQDYDAQRESIYCKYYEYGEEIVDVIPAEKIYGSSDFLKVLMTAIGSCQGSELFELSIINWFELGGVIENTSPLVFERSAKGQPVKKVDYPYNNAVYLPTNLSVTEIKKQMNEEMYFEEFVPSEFIFRKPSFVRKAKKSLTPAEIGTAYHALLAALDYKSLPDDIAEFKENIVGRGILTAEEADAIDDNRIKAYIDSPIAAEISGATGVYKEHSFTMGLKASEIYPALKGDSTAENEIILTHGIIDLYYEREDGFVIVDFKTDRSTDYDMLRKAYAPQLNIYKTALETALGRKVVRLCLYCLNEGHIIDL